MFSLFKDSLIPASVDQIKNIWNEVSSEDKKIFFTKNSALDRGFPYHYKRSLRKVIYRGRIDVAEYLYSLADSYENKNQSIQFKLLSESTEEGETELVDFILKKNPELLEKKCALYKGEKNQELGTVLELAVIMGNKEMVDILLSHGADTKPLKGLISSEVFIENSESASMAIAEQTILRGILGNTGLPKAEKIKTLHL